MRNVLVAFYLLVAGAVSLLHHGLVCGIWFDLSDFPFGHDWYGLGAVIISLALLYEKRGA